MTELVLIFSGITLLNVVLSTIKSLFTIKGNKSTAALANAISWGVNTFAVFYTADEGLDIWIKAIITVFANLIGVYMVKWVEGKIRKDRLWIFEGTVKADEAYCQQIKQLLNQNDISLLYTTIREDKLYEVKAFATTKEESKKIKLVLDLFNKCKYYIIEAK